MIQNSAHTATIPGLPYMEASFTLRLNEDSVFPAIKGSMFRGAFGSAFRNTVCFTRRPECVGCPLQASCTYFTIFETEMPGNAVWFLRGVKKTPHPFLFKTYHLDRTQYQKGELISIRVVIFGDVQLLFPFFVLSFIRMGDIGISVRRHRFTLQNVTAMNPNGAIELLYHDGTMQPVPADCIRNCSLDADAASLPDRVSLHLHSHLALQREGRVLNAVSQVTPAIVFNALARRYFGLLHLFGKPRDQVYLPPVEDTEPVLDTTGLWYDTWDRYSNRFGGKMTFGGFMGKITIMHPTLLQYRLLIAGQVTAFGKNTVFGSGQYTLQ